MSIGYQFTDAQIEDALMRNFGNVTMAAIEIGADPTTIRKRVNREKREQFAACRFESEERLLDLSEAGMAQHVVNGSESMIRFHLLQRGRSRGFGNRTELSGPDGGAIPIQATPVLDFDTMPDDERELLRELLLRQRARALGSE